MRASQGRLHSLWVGGWGNGPPPRKEQGAASFLSCAVGDTLSFVCLVAEWAEGGRWRVRGLSPAGLLSSGLWGSWRSGRRNYRGLVAARLARNAGQQFRRGGMAKAVIRSTSSRVAGVLSPGCRQGWLVDGGHAAGGNVNNWATEGEAAAAPAPTFPQHCDPASPDINFGILEKCAVVGQTPHR